MRRVDVGQSLRGQFQHLLGPCVPPDPVPNKLITLRMCRDTRTRTSGMCVHVSVSLNVESLQCVPEKYLGLRLTRFLIRRFQSQVSSHYIRLYISQRFEFVNKVRY